MDALYYWSCILEDRYDHHTRLTAYILTGLFDEFDSIRNKSLEILEKCG